MRRSFSGVVFSGMGKGRYYVGHPEYQRRFLETLDYRPYPGTLNITLDQDSVAELRALRSKPGKTIQSFMIGDETFSGLNCLDGEMGSERVTLLFIDITHYNEKVAELISPAFLRGKLGLKDGDRVEFSLIPQ